MKAEGPKVAKVGAANSTFTKTAAGGSNSKRDRSDSQFEQAHLLAAISTKPGQEVATVIVAANKNGASGKMGKLKAGLVLAPASSTAADANATEQTQTDGIISASGLPQQSIGKRQVSDASEVSTSAADAAHTSLPFKKRRKPDSNNGNNSSSESSDQLNLLAAERELALAVGRIVEGTGSKDTDSERNSTCSSRSSEMVVETAVGEGSGGSFVVENDGISAMEVQVGVSEVESKQ